jgi:hypothetical protein
MIIVLVNLVSAVVNAINILLTLGLLIYALRIRSMFKGGLIGKTTPIFAASALFLFAYSYLHQWTTIEQAAGK